MIPKSFSATALQTAEACLARYYAENILRTEREDSDAASLGTAVHSALEWYVQGVFVKKEHEESLEALLNLFKMAYAATFGTFDYTGADYKDGVEMLKRWYARTNFHDRTVLSCEVKESFPIPTSLGPIPFNYIWDRFDQVDEFEYEVVDYKSIRAYLSPEDLLGKIQARFYALAAQIKFPQAKRIWVCFDLLRYEPIKTCFTREENIATWNYAKASAERIIRADPTDLVALEKLNVDCRWCTRKVSCKAVQSNIAGGGVHTISNARDVVDLRANLDYQWRAAKAAMDEIDKIIIQQAGKEGVLEFESEQNKLRITARATRSIDPERVSRICPPQLFYKYGGPTMNYTNFGKLLKDPLLPADIKGQLQQLVITNMGEPYVKVSSQNPIDKRR